MNVLVPLNHKEHLIDYQKSGAKEFYLGFYDEAWHETFGEYADINRLTGFKKTANSYSLSEVLDLIAEQKTQDNKIFITFNASLYSKQQLEWIETYMRQLKEVDCDGVIVSCIELVKIAKRVGLFCVISTIAGVYNEDIAKFYFDYGANRMILPRDLSVDEIEEIVTKVPESEYEVFMMRNGCAFSDSNCLGLHRTELSSVCSTLNHGDCETCMDTDDFYKRHDAELNNDLFNEQFHNVTCGVCSIYRFLKMGIKACKIVGRSDEWENICYDISLVYQNIQIAKECSSQEEFLNRMIFPRSRRTTCRESLSCYYPEMRF